MPRLIPYPWAARALAILLFAAALLKVHGLRVAPVGQIGAFAAPATQVAVIEVEVCLALWLLAGKRRQGAWLAAAAVFAVFAGASGYQGWIGQSSCGCFGKLSVNPWYAFAGDLGVIAMLFVARPTAEAPGERNVVGRMQSAGLGRAGFASAGLVLVLALFCGTLSWAYGSLDTALAAFRGELVSTEPALVNVGEGAPGESREAQVKVFNRTDHAIRLIGAMRD